MEQRERARNVHTHATCSHTLTNRRTCTRTRAQTERCVWWRRRDVHVRDTRETPRELRKVTRPGINAIKRPTNRGDFAFRLVAKARFKLHVGAAQETIAKGGFAEAIGGLTNGYMLESAFKSARENQVKETKRTEIAKHVRHTGANFT